MSTLAALSESFKAKTEQDMQQAMELSVQNLKDVLSSLLDTSQREASSTASVIKNQHQALRQTVTENCQDTQDLYRAVSGRFLRRLLLLSLPVCLMTAIGCIGCMVVTHYQCRSMEATSVQRLEDIQKNIDQYQTAHRKIAEQFQNLQAYQDENGLHYLALGKAWRLKEVREKNGHVLWQVVKR